MVSLNLRFDPDSEQNAAKALLFPGCDVTLLNEHDMASMVTACEVVWTCPFILNSSMTT